MQTNKENNLEQIRVALQREFIERCRKNSSYSLRAFAKYLEIDQSFLSKLLKGQRAITPEFAESVAPKLGLRPAQVKDLFSKGTASMPGFLSLTDDEFELLSEWYHFAIIELSKTNDFDHDPSAIAARLGIHIEEVRSALQRLDRLGFIKLQENGDFKVLAPNTAWGNSKSTSALRKNFQRTLLEKSMYALDHVPFEFRDNSSTTVAINKKRIPEFREKIQEMRKELADFFQPEGEPGLDEVYQLTVSFFPLSKLNNSQGDET